MYAIYITYNKNTRKSGLFTPEGLLETVNDIKNV